MNRSDRDSVKTRKYHRWSLAAWIAKFGCAFRGWYLGSRSETSFAIHYLASAAVVGGAIFFSCNLIEWCLLILCISLVWMAELFNTAIENLSRAISPGYHEQVGKALDIASGAVLVISLGTAAIGGLIFVPKLVSWLQ
jgi:diacylglycerol kinase